MENYLDKRLPRKSKKVLKKISCYSLNSAFRNVKIVTRKLDIGICNHISNIKFTDEQAKEFAKSMDNTNIHNSIEDFRNLKFNF